MVFVQIIMNVTCILNEEVSIHELIVGFEYRIKLRE